MERKIPENFDIDSWLDDTRECCEGTTACSSFKCEECILQAPLVELKYWLFTELWVNSEKREALRSEVKKRKTNKAKNVDRTCRNHGACPWCRGNRLYQAKKRAEVVDYA